MSVQIHTITNEAKRGCGYRTPGGLYLVGGYKFEVCHRLPYALDVCPACSQGVKQCRGFLWIEPHLLFGQCVYAQGGIYNGHCESCYLCSPREERAGLLWVGTKFYPTPADFMMEGLTQGISKRISRVPRGLKLGETVIYMAHPKAVEVPMTINDNGTFAPAGRGPGIFTAFVPKAMEYVVKGNETEAELERKVKQGITLVRLVRTAETEAA